MIKYLNFLKFTKAKTSQKNIFRDRTRFLFFILLFILLLILFRLYSIQVIHSEVYKQKAQDQYVRESSRFYDRGEIYFLTKDGNEVVAATMKDWYILALDIRKIKNTNKLYKELSKIIFIDKNRFDRAIKKKGDPYEEIAKGLTKEEKNKIEKLKLPGVLLVKERKRYYPANQHAAQTIGFVGFTKKSDEKKGVYGLEKYYEDVLHRSDSTLRVNFFAQLFSDLKGFVFAPSTKREGDIVLTIEPNTQIYLEDTIEKMRKKWESEMTAGIIINPKTGAILAMAISPTFDLNNYSNANTKLFSNILIQDVYEMGSIVKPITMASAINEGLVNANTTYNDRGFVRIGDRTIYNFDKRGRGPRTTMQDVISESLNTGVVFVLHKMGKKTFRRYFNKFGLNEETGIDMPNEPMNLISNLDTNRDIEYATATFGQGIALTPISMTRALCAIATGELPQPHLVSKIRSTNGLVDNRDYSDLKIKVLKDETVHEITKMLVKAVDTKLLGGSMKIKNYSVAAKTGTAQIAKRSGGYYSRDVLHTYFGYFPAYEPKFLVFLMNLKPHGAKYSSQTISKYFFDIVHFLIDYYDIPPDR